MKKALMVLLVLVAGLGGIAQAQLAFWQRIYTSGTPPSPRKGHIVVATLSPESLFVFGGQDSSGLTNDLYALSDHYYAWTWSQLNPGGTPPSPRAGHTAILVPSLNRILIFGGYTASGGCLNDLWALDSLKTGGHWSQLAPAGTPPSGRAEHTAIYDSLFDRMIVYAGRDSASNHLGDLWALDSVSAGNGRWHQMFPGGMPPLERFDHSAAYYSGNRTMTVFGGKSDTGALADLYSLDLTSPEGTWSALNPGGQAPSARYGHVATYTLFWPGTMFLFGGQSDSIHFLDDTYFLETQWFRDYTGYAPAPRSQMAVFPGSSTPYWWLFGIVGGDLGDSLANDVWANGSINAVNDQSSREAREKPGLTVSPNPMQGNCRITIPAGNHERISIYDLTGRLIKTFAPEASQGREGSTPLIWDGRDKDGRAVSRGVYFIRSHGSSHSDAGKIVVLR